MILSGGEEAYGSMERDFACCKWIYLVVCGSCYGRGLRHDHICGNTVAAAESTSLGEICMVGLVSFVLLVCVFIFLRNKNYDTIVKQEKIFFNFYQHNVWWRTHDWEA